MAQSEGILSKDEEERIENYFSSLKYRFLIERESDQRIEELSALLDQFEVLKGYDVITIADAVKVSDGTSECIFCILLCEVTSSILHYGAINQHNTREIYASAFASLSKDFGHTLIRPEQIRDKAAEIFQQRELDFPEHPYFSRFYYVLATDESKVRQNMCLPLLDAIYGYTDLVIEILGHTLVAGKPKQFHEQDATELLEFTLLFSKLEKQ